jgi:hypothetical protein
MEMIMGVTFLYKKQKPTLSSGLAFPNLFYTNATLLAGAKAPKPEAVKVGIEAKHRKASILKRSRGSQGACGTRAA